MPFRQANLGLQFEILEDITDEPARGTVRADVLENLPFSLKVPFGTGSGQANKGYFRKETLAAGATVTRDLSGGLTDRDGNTIDLDLLKMLVLVNYNTVDSVSIGPLGAANPVGGLNAGTAAGSIAGKAVSAKDPGWCVSRFPAGITVTAATADQIQIINNDGANTADIYWGFIGVDSP